MTSPERIEHRREPRYQRLVQVRIGHRELISANVSLHGMQIVCPLMRFEGIKADVRRGQLAAQVTLPRGASLGATLTVRYCSDSGDEVLIGVELAFPDSDAQASWAAYIDELSRGPGSAPG